MKKTGQFWEDTLEKIEDFGSSTIKNTSQSLKQTFSPLNLLENIISPAGEKESQNSSKEKDRKKTSHTPLNFEKLEKKYQEQDKIKLEQARQRLFQLVKKGEEEVIQTKKKEEQEKKQKEIMEKQKKDEEEKKKQKLQQQEAIPKSKIRKSIFSPKKTAQRQHFEFKPSGGKN